RQVLKHKTKVQNHQHDAIKHMNEHVEDDTEEQAA
ncbi:MAG: hypothetical protein RL748_3969, partial [Pseudomonadota bacterium]